MKPRVRTRRKPRKHIERAMVVERARSIQRYTLMLRRGSRRRSKEQDMVRKWEGFPSMDGRDSM